MQLHSCLLGILIIYGVIVESSNRRHAPKENDFGMKDRSFRFLSLVYPDNQIMSDLDLSLHMDPQYDTVDHVLVRGVTGRGPLTTFPQSICRFQQLKHLDLSYNRINGTSVFFPPRCLPVLQTLNLSNNFLLEASLQANADMPPIQELDLSHNQIRSISSEMFDRIVNLEKLDMSDNRLTTFELGLVQIQELIDYSDNPVTHFTSHYNRSLSDYQSNITKQILMSNTGTMIDFDDGLLEMYARCGEINGTQSPVVMEAIKRIHDSNPGLLLGNCSCDRYHIQKYLVINGLNKDFSTWQCSDEESIPYREKCRYRSSFNSENVVLRWCEIDRSASDDFFGNLSGLEAIVPAMRDKLKTTNLTSIQTAWEFADRIDQFNSKLEQLATSEKVIQSIRIDLQTIITTIEELVESISIPIRATFGSVAILSVSADSFVYSFAQTEESDASFSYDTGTDMANATTSITINQESTKNLSSTDVYTFYYLPSSLFQHAQNNHRKIIVSPIVGIYLPNRAPRLINMSFTHTQQSSGSYSCEFWQAGNWNDTGCYYQRGLTPTRHLCFCNHTTSFALLFLPDKPIHQAYVPSITVGIVSIVCFVSSIILSACRQSISFRQVSIANISTLLNSIALFVLLTVTLIRGYQESKRQVATTAVCATLERNLAIATYFFLISTFASRTLLGIYYFLAIFARSIVLQFNSLSNKWLYIGLVLVMIVALIPTIIVQQWSKLFVRYEEICWLDVSAVFLFVSVPILIFIALNLLTILAITTRLWQFVRGRTKSQTSEKRLGVSLLIWLSLYISLGIAWMVGPFLSLTTTQRNRSAVIVVQWIFALFIGLEGVWVLIVNVVFYLNQKRNTEKRPVVFNKTKKSDF